MNNFWYILVLLFCQTISSQVIDSENSRVIFKVNNMNVRTVEGEFTGMDGTVTFNENNTTESYFNVCVNTDTIKTDRKKRDENLKNKDFFDVENYPEICFESLSIIKIFGDYIIEGKLTLLGVTKPIKIPVSFNDDTFTGTFEINRLDYNLGKKISTFMINNNVAITVVCKLNIEG